MGIFLSPSSAASGSRPNWARVYSTTLGVRGGASTTVETTDSATTSSSAAAAAAADGPSRDPFQHLPGIEVCTVVELKVNLEFVESK